MFSYDGSTVSRKKLEEAINVFVKIEEEYQVLYREAYELKNFDFDENGAYAEIKSKYKEECAAALKAVIEYGKQIHPNDLASMQEEFYKIVNSGSDVRRSIAYSLLSSAWSGIGEWIN
ncbi:MAG: hypothetical protein ACYCSB_06840 [bacterium]